MDYHFLSLSKLFLKQSGSALVFRNWNKPFLTPWTYESDRRNNLCYSYQTKKLLMLNSLNTREQENPGSCYSIRNNEFDILHFLLFYFT